MFESEMPQVSDLGTGNHDLAGAKQFESLPSQKLGPKKPAPERRVPDQDVIQG
jgi:hypothetical protein